MWGLNTGTLIYNLLIVCVRDFTGIHESLNTLKHIGSLSLWTEEEEIFSFQL